jgi:hypothetical protein
VKFKKQPIFLREYQRLTAQEREKFLEALSVFITSVKHFEQHPEAFIWPTSLRFEKLVGFNQIYAITWSFKQPDGRATFRMETMSGEMWITWRRIGRHDIYKNP